MDFEQLKDVWNKAEQQVENESNNELRHKLSAVTSTQQKIRQYFQYEIAIAVTGVILFGLVVYFLVDLETYFYKLFAIIFLGSTPLNYRLYMSVKRLSNIDYSNQLQRNLILAKNHLKTTIRIYYTVIVLTIVALVFMSWGDNYFLQLPVTWQVGIMAYFLLFLISSIYWVNRLYGRRLRELRALLEDL